jgi:hypothetical protein
MSILAFGPRDEVANNQEPSWLTPVAQTSCWAHSRQYLHVGNFISTLPECKKDLEKALILS